MATPNGATRPGASGGHGGRLLIDDAQILLRLGDGGGLATLAPPTSPATAPARFHRLLGGYPGGSATGP